MITFAERLIELRERANWSATDLADLAGISRQMVFLYEHKGASPTLGALQRICKVLGVPLDAFADCEVPAHVKRPGRPRKVK